MTTGPLLNIRFNDKQAGQHIELPVLGSKTPLLHSAKITGTADSPTPLTKIEVIKNGKIAQTIQPENSPLPEGGYRTELDVKVRSSSENHWVAIRCFSQTEEGRPRFAHTAPVFVTLPEKEWRPSIQEVDYLISRVQGEIKRHQGVVSTEVLAEFEQALAAYQTLKLKAEK